MPAPNNGTDGIPFAIFFNIALFLSISKTSILLQQISELGHRRIRQTREVGIASAGCEKLISRRGPACQHVLSCPPSASERKRATSATWERNRVRRMGKEPVEAAGHDTFACRVISRSAPPGAARLSPVASLLLSLLFLCFSSNSSSQILFLRF
jgi:hypothetical protein